MAGLTGEVTEGRCFAALPSSVTGTLVNVTALIGYARVSTADDGRRVFAIFVGPAEFERELIVERTKAGLAAARARGRSGGRPFKMTPAKPRLVQAAMRKPETKVAEPYADLAITRQTLYRFVGSRGVLRGDGRRRPDLRKRRQPARGHANT